MKDARYKKSGWHGESYRHYLAAKGVKTGRKNPAQFYRLKNPKPDFTV